METLKVIVRQPLEATSTSDKFDVIVNVHGGGFTGQAGAIRHGISRALLKADEDYRPTLKKAGFLTRDPRMKERKKLRSQSCTSCTTVLQEIIKAFTRSYRRIFIPEAKTSGIFSNIRSARLLFS